MISNINQPIRYELTFKCTFWKKCKPIIVINEKISEWKQIGKTEISNSKDNTKIQFKKSIMVDYKSDKIQNLMIDIRDVESGQFIYPCDHKCIGSLNTTLNEIISSPNGMFKDRCGSNTLEIHAHQLPESPNSIIIKLSASNLDKKDLLTSSSDPYLYISKEVEDHGFIRVYESEVLKKCLSPSFQAINLNICNFNSNDMSKKIKFEIYDYNKISAHELIGEFITTTQDLLNGEKKDSQFEIINPKKKASKSTYKHSGIVKFSEVTLIKTPTIFDYINGGFDINLTFGLNLTSSKDNIHDISDIQSNLYVQAIQSICNTLKPFNCTNSILVRGFACIHEKPLEGNITCQCKSFKLGSHQTAHDIVDKYVKEIGNFNGKGSSNCTHLINHSSKKAIKNSKLNNNNSYTILVVLTHGDIPEGIFRSDILMAVHDASNSPISIIIVGLGSEEFNFTRVLDGDKNPIKNYKGEVWKRDCVQFVHFNHHHVDPYGFSQELIYELPTQFLNYVKMNHILPPR